MRQLATRITFFDNLETQVKIFQRQALQAHREPTRKNVHQLRITVRRIRASLWLAEHGSPPVSCEKIKSQLCQLGHALGKLRELDVAIQDAEKFHLKTKRLKQKRKSAQNNLRRESMIRHCLKISKGLQKILTKKMDCQKLNLNPGFTILQRKFLPWTQKTLKANDDFHRLRILTKKTRYALEIIGKPTGPLRDLQEILGVGHDLEVLQKFLGKNPILQSEMNKHYKNALLLIRPTIRFAMNNLK